jgi:peptidyl-prolyl cis-trans isomerase D
MIKVILFAIVIVFVFWGVGSFRSRQASKVATVNDEIIAVSDFRRAYNNLIEQYRQRFGDNLNDGMLEMLNVKEQALNQLIDQAIVLQEARKLDLMVTDAEVAESIMSAPVFQANGSFDNNRYRRLLAQIHLTPEEFEADQKNALLTQKLNRVVAGAAKVSDGEARLWYDWKNASVNVDYVLFESNRYKDIDPSEQEIAAYFDEQKENYKTDPMVKASYVVFDPDAYKTELTVAEDEIADYYDSNIDEFKTEKTVEARHILIKVDPNADEEADNAARAKAEEIAKLARGGEDFAELAKTRSEGPTKDKGGYLGKFQKSQMVKPFADKAFSMAAGEISDPVKTRFGWHVIKVESVEEANTQTLEEAKDRIVATLKQRKARNLAYDRAEAFYETCYEEEDLIHNAETFNLTVQDAGSFTRKGPESLGNAKGPFAKVAFTLEKGEITDIQDIQGRYYIIQATEIIEAAVPELDAVKTRVRKDLIQKMQTDKALEEAEAMAADLTAEKTFEESAGEHGVEIKHTGLFKRNASIPVIGSDPQVSQAAFQLASSGDTTREPVKGRAGYYLLRLMEKKAPAADGFESEKENIKKTLLQQKQRTLMKNWIAARKAESEIKIENSYLE